ncbi:rhamnogalacturonan acetylesterase [Jiulongibacter sp. NS-SX5]|uniref:rhamnogalacturonan acetylesterase n=1 Tax=Jiulongibacter sp. NS-SX5 TaxID=3463854 RepID=UPI0040594613
MNKYLCLFPLLFLFQPSYTQKQFIFGTQPETTLANGLQFDQAQFYTESKGYGFVRNNSELEFGDDYCRSEESFLFEFDLPEGNYEVEIGLGGTSEYSRTFIKAENRRWMAGPVLTRARQDSIIQFLVNVRNSTIENTSDAVRLKPRELSYNHWDHKLTLEFSGVNPSVRSIRVKPLTGQYKTIFLAGNSTVVDQQKEPYTAWGQMLPAMLKHDGVVVANHAESGESSLSFIHENRLKKILSKIKPGDFLFIAFAHNDQKIKNYRPFIEYKKTLKAFIDSTRSYKATPVLVTSMHRRNFDLNEKIINTLGDFPEAMRQLAKEENVTLIDLNKISKTLWETLSKEESKKAFVHVKANTFPGQTEAIEDNTHFSNYGAYLLAKAVASEIDDKIPSLANSIFPEFKDFNPENPLPISKFDFPESRFEVLEVPDGN